MPLRRRSAIQYHTNTLRRDNPGLFQDYEELEDRLPKNTYPMAGCAAHLEHCRTKVRSVLPGEMADILVGNCGFPWRELTRLELHIYNIRHIQHHAAQLGLRRQLAGSDPLRWVGGD